MKFPTPTELTFILEIIQLLDNNFAILFERLGIPYEAKVIDGRLEHGYGIKKNGDFFFKLPDDYFKEYKRYTFNFRRNLLIFILLAIFFFFS